VRRPIPSLAYVDLGENNGGIILNIGEDGLAASSAAPLDSDRLARIRFQLPGSSDRLEASGEIAWISESKKQAGLRFVDLSDNVRSQIRGWISSQAPSIKFQSDGVAAREKAWRRLEMPTTRMPQSLPPQPARPDRVTQVQARVPTPALNAASTLFGAAASGVDPTSFIRRQQQLGATGYRPSVEAGGGLRKVLAQRRTWGILAVVVILGASFVFGWFMGGGPGSGNHAWFGKTNLETRETANGREPSATTSVTSIPGPSMQNAPLSSSGSVPAPVNSGSNVVGSSVQLARPKPRVLEPGSVSATANTLGPRTESVPSPGPGSVAQQRQQTNVTAPPDSNVTQPESPRMAGAAGQENSLAVKPADSPEVTRGSVSLSFDFNPSIRVLAGLKSQMSGPGTNLQAGQLLSRVDPVYPEDAKTQRVEGTVVLHIIIGQDGTIHSVEPKSGPALLIPAAANAIRKWRYTVSTAGGQPVEAEEDITIEFRLLTQAAHSN
jgi:TonB family protein